MGRSSWVTVPPQRSYGLVHYNYEGSGRCPWELGGVHLGTPLIIKRTNGPWYLASRVTGGPDGIIPKSFVTLKPPPTSNHHPLGMATSEINQVIREWTAIAKQLFVSRYVPISRGADPTEAPLPSFNAVKELLLNLHDSRTRLLSADLTVQGQKELRKEVANIIDIGNCLLRLDMVVRDELGAPLDSLATSTIQLFRSHHQHAQIISKYYHRQESSSKRSSGQFIHSSYSLLVTLDKIMWKVADRSEVRFFLYDGTTETPFTENVQYIFNSQPNLSHKFIFTDLVKSDFERGKVYLVAYVVRIGPMEYKETGDSSRGGRSDNPGPFSDKKNSITVRRPFGVAFKDITNLFNETSASQADSNIHYLPYVPCGGEEGMDDTLKRLIASSAKNMELYTSSSSGKDVKSTSFGFQLRLLMIAGTTQQIQEKLVLIGSPVINRKMGFPEVILPNDIRNDLYVNLIRGDFHRSAKSSDRNVEVTVSLHDEAGRLLGGLLWGGNGDQPDDHYRSVVYYHNDKPRWNEFFKVSLPMNIEEFSTAHVKFTFKHRSSNDSKDRAEKPFALTYLRLKQPEGTALKDDIHELIVYKIDPKHYRESEVQYLSLPYVRSPSWQGAAKPCCPGFSCSPKDYFSIRTKLCSTNFTQNADLLELLLWVTKLRQLEETTMKEDPTIGKEELVTILLGNLKKILENMTKVAGEEIVKFLHPIFDALFFILSDPMEQISTDLTSSSLQSSSQFSNGVSRLDESSTACDRSVFECFLHIFGLILDHKYQNFQSVLNLYIEENFSSTLAYTKLGKELQNSILHDNPKVVLKVMKSIQFFFKFIVKSFQIHKRFRIDFGQTEQDREDEEGFEWMVEGLFKGMCSLLERRDEGYIGAQGGCLKHIPSVIEDLIVEFSSRRLSEHLVELWSVVPSGKLPNFKLTFTSLIVHSPLFKDPECRFMLLPIVAASIQQHLPGNDEELRRRSLENQQKKANHKLLKILGPGMELPLGVGGPAPSPTHSEETEKCVDLLGDIMDLLHLESDEVKISHVCYVMQILLRPIIFSIGTIGEGDPLAGHMVSIFLALLREMRSYHYGILINSLLKGDSSSAGDPYKHALLKFLNDVLVVLKNLFQTSYFPKDWNAMILLQNSIVLTALENFASTIKAEFGDPFEEQPWNNFFISTVSFLTQPSLQLEEFFGGKEAAIRSTYGDMRKRAADLIRNMWFSLGVSKRSRFVPSMVGTFMEMALLPQPDIRQSTIHIFFDMMHCEFDQDRPLRSFEKVEEELIRKIVEGFEGGKGDPAFRSTFHETMTEMCNNAASSGLMHSGLTMISTTTRLMDLLLEYREVLHEEDAGNRMGCLVNLLDFSKEMNRKELYLRYLYKLHDLHIQLKNYTEAAFTLKLHSHQLEWSDEEVPGLLQNNYKYPNLPTQTDLREALYNDIIQDFDTAKMWECALEVCNELVGQYEETYNYSKLPKLHRQMAELYDKILSQLRFKPTYFRVGFYGRGFPTFLQDKVFVYRGASSEHLTDFEARLLGRFPQAEVLKNLESPSDEVRDSLRQYVQICTVDPVESVQKRLSGIRYAEDNIRMYYKGNEVDKFSYDRPYHTEPKDPTNEFASLSLDRYTLWTAQSFPGIMSWFPVVRDTLTKVSPIENAIETLEKANQGMRDLILTHCLNPNEDLGHLTMKLNGTLDAAVMGGVAKYEAAFLTPEYLNSHPRDGALVQQVKTLICSQVPILDECLKIHGRRSHATIKKLHERFEELFKGFMDHINTFYSVNPKELTDPLLSREMARTLKKQQKAVVVKRVHDHPSTGGGSRNSDLYESKDKGRGSNPPGRTTGSFSSTVSIYHAASACKSRPLAYVSQKPPQYFRRSAHHSSFSVEGSRDQGEFSPPSPSVGGGSQHGSFATLPRSASVFQSSASLGSKTNLDRDPPIIESQPPPTVALTQTLTLARPPRLGGLGRDARKSFSGLESPFWNQPSPPPSSADLAGQKSSSLETVETVPPLPPKRDRSEGPPPPPPKKPPLKQLLEN